MIEWMTVDELDEYLADVPPIGLRLDAFFNARICSDIDTWFERAPIRRGLDGLGPIQTWAGLVDGVPFAIGAMQTSTYWGVDVRFPHPTSGDGLLVAALRSLALPTWSRPFFYPLPISGGYEVRRVGAHDDSPLYSSSSSSDADDVLALLDCVEPESYTVVAGHKRELPWIVIGPATGKYFSRVEIEPDEQSAHQLATRWKMETNATFDTRRRA